MQQMVGQFGIFNPAIALPFSTYSSYAHAVSWTALVQEKLTGPDPGLDAVYACFSAHSERLLRWYLKGDILIKISTEEKKIGEMNESCGPPQNN